MLSDRIRAGFFEMDFEFLRGLLRLPDGVRIRRIDMAEDRRYPNDVLRVYVEGGDLPEQWRDTSMTKLDPQYREVGGRIEFVSWYPMKG
jgi:hypothetical protein